MADKPQVAAERMQAVDLEDGYVYLVVIKGHAYPRSCHATYVEAQRALSAVRKAQPGVAWETTSARVVPSEAERVTQDVIDRG